MIAEKEPQDVRKAALAEKEELLSSQRAKKRVALGKHANFLPVGPTENAGKFGCSFAIGFEANQIIS